MNLNYTHLSRVGFAYSNTAVGRFALYRLRKAMNEEGLCKDEEVVAALVLCKHCSQKLNPNCKFSVERVKKKPYKNCVVYTCNNCNKKTRFKGAPKAEPRKPSEKIHIKFPENDVKSVLNPVPLGHRTLTQKRQKPPEKKSIIESFFQAEKSSHSLYNLFH